MMFRRPGDGTRLLAGRADPADVTRFTIDYLHNGQPGTIDGWHDDDSVTLAPRAGQVARETPGGVWWSPGGAPMADWIEQAGGTYDVAAQPIPPHRRFFSLPINLGPRPGAATAPATARSTSAPPTTAHSP